MLNRVVVDLERGDRAQHTGPGPGQQDALRADAQSDAAQREKIREIFRNNYAFAWAATPPFPADSEERFRQHLIHFSIIDQGRDWRDQILWMRDLLRSPFATRDVVEEVASMSDDWARDQMLRAISI